MGYVLHPYATDSPANPKFIAAIAIAAAIVAPLITELARCVDSRGAYLSGVSAMAVFGLLYVVFDRCLWRVPMARRFLLVPNLNGEWKCIGHTMSKDGQPVSYEWSGTIKIRQSWSTIAIVLQTNQSMSRSIAASLYRDPSGGFRLIYHYENDPGIAEAELRRHTGLCRILVSENTQAAVGNYYTDKDRTTIGTMELTRQSGVPSAKT